MSADYVCQILCML